MASIWKSLKQAVRKTFARIPEPEPANAEEVLDGMIESGDFSIDLGQRTATLRGLELQLTSEEFDVLVFLAGHPRRLITPRTVLTTNWTLHRIRQADFLKALMSLRGKVNAVAGPGRQYLRTEPWVLYRFDPASLSAP